MYTQIKTWIFRLISTFLAAIVSIGIIFFTGPGSDASAQIFRPLSAKELPEPKICNDIKYPSNVEEKDEILWKAAEGESNFTLATLKSLVDIQSGTFDNNKKMGDIANLIEKHLVEKIKGMKKEDVNQVTPRPPKSGDYDIGKIVVGTLKGTKKGGKKLLLLAHMDTVYPYNKDQKPGEHLFKEENDQEGRKVLTGPGVGDDKAGIAVILHSLELLRKGDTPILKDEDFTEITVLINADEEKGSIGSSKEIEDWAEKRSDVIFSYESTQFSPFKPDVELISESLSGIKTLVVTVNGKPAHAGANPDQGVNALVEASDLVKRTVSDEGQGKKLDQGEGSLRFNWTIFNTKNTVSNIIPDEVTLTADVRYPDQEKYDEIYKELEQQLKKKYLNYAELKLDEELEKQGRLPFNTTKVEGCGLIQNAVDIYKSVGGNIELVGGTGGGSDAGFAAVSGKPVIEGLGLPGYGYHTQTTEGIYIEAIPRRLYLSAKMILNETKGLSSEFLTKR